MPAQESSTMWSDCFTPRRFRSRRRRSAAAAPSGPLAAAGSRAGTCCSVPQSCTRMLRAVHAIQNRSVLRLTWGRATTSVEDNEIMSAARSWFPSAWRLSRGAKDETPAKCEEPRPQSCSECQACTGASCSSMIRGYLCTYRGLN